MALLLACDSELHVAAATKGYDGHSHDRDAPAAASGGHEHQQTFEDSFNNAFDDFVMVPVKAGLSKGGSRDVIDPTAEKLRRKSLVYSALKVLNQHSKSLFGSLKNKDVIQRAKGKEFEDPENFVRLLEKMENEKTDK